MTTTATGERDLPIAQHVGEVLHTLMWKKKVSQTEAGRSIGVGQSTMGKKLRGEVPITVDELVMLAGLLDAEPSDLLPSLRARRDSNPQPSGLESERLQLVWSVRESLTPELPLGLDRPRVLRAVS